MRGPTYHSSQNPELGPIQDPPRKDEIDQSAWSTLGYLPGRTRYPPAEWPLLQPDQDQSLFSRIIANPRYRRLARIAGAVVLIGVVVATKFIPFSDVLDDEAEEAGGNPVPVSVTRPLPTASDIAEFEADTKSTCEDVSDDDPFKAPPEIKSDGHGLYTLENDAARIVITGREPMINIPEGVRADEVFFCAADGILAYPWCDWQARHICQGRIRR